MPRTSVATRPCGLKPHDIRRDGIQAVGSLALHWHSAYRVMVSGAVKAIRQLKGAFDDGRGRALF